MEEPNYQQVRAHVIRASPDTAHVAIDSFASGQITVPVPTRTLTDATGLPRQQLTEAELIVTANIAARADTNVRPHDWQLLTPADEHPTTHRSALPAIAA
ncbi:hypothetical protein [Streptomyces sp. NBC_01637]|uniref:hypothetical protein n=1 Tax=unclassified Streptomyces TaxID=2593676 RepID=UPI00386530FA|nr:hypothetical protein OH719_07940 [Streptomyces sp. NBC_01653]WTD37645.1 hypothetical protein OHB03_38670 [Streptomyces sp. NBC_01643]WTD93051.1 hypothetical protein OG891_38930 [Streptomyces sp. NBC_01637]